MTMAGASAGPVSAVTKPENCVMLVGIPTTEHAFSDSIWHGGNRFASQSGSFRYYKADFVRPFSRFAFRARRLGLRIEAAATRSALGKWTRFPNVHGVVVFSHWDCGRQGLEFADGFASAEAFVAEVPTDYTGFVDLSTCDSHDLAAELRVSRRRLSSIVYRSTTATPRVWLTFYDLLFRLLSRRDLDYLGATDRIAREVMGAAAAFDPRDSAPGRGGDQG